MSWRTIRETAAGSLDIFRRGYALLITAFAVDSAFIFVFLIALQSYLPESLHESDAIAGVALASFGVAKLATQVGSGFISDRLGPRRALILGTGLLLAADISIVPLAHVAPWAIVASAAVVGLGSSVTWPALFSAGDARFSHGEKGRFTALLTLSSGGALAVALGGGTLLNSVASFDVAMLAPITGVALAFALSIFIHTRSTRSSERDGFALPTIREMGSILGDPRRASFTALVLVEAAAIGALTATFRAYGRDVLDVSLARQSVLMLPAAVAGALVVVPGGVIADRIGSRWVMTMGFALTGVCMLLLGRWNDTAFVAVTAAAAGTGIGLALPAIASTMMSLAGSTGRRGGVIGWFMTMDGIGHAAGPASAGVLLALLGAEAVLIAAGSLFLMAAYISATSRVGVRHAIEPVGAETHAVAESIVGG